MPYPYPYLSPRRGSIANYSTSVSRGSLIFLLTDSPNAQPTTNSATRTTTKNNTAVLALNPTPSLD